MVSIRTNTAALNAQRHISVSQQRTEQLHEQLASGSRINNATDNAAGLQLSNRLSQQVYGLDIAKRNANEGISVMQTADGAMDETINVLERMRDLSLQSANASNTDGDRSVIQEEVSVLNDELNRIAETTSFGGKKLLNGTYGQASFQLNASSGEATIVNLKDMRSDSDGMSGFSYTASTKADKDWVVSEQQNQLIISYQDGNDEQQIEINAKAGDNIEELATYINGQTDEVAASVNEKGQLQIYTSAKGHDDLSFSGNLAEALDMGSRQSESVDTIDVSTVGGAQVAVGVLDTALGYVSGHQSELGAMQNRFDHAINDMDNMRENISDSNRRIKDTDYVKLTTNLVREQIMQQMGGGVLAQAKSSPNTALSLLS